MLFIASNLRFKPLLCRPENIIANCFNRIYDNILHLRYKWKVYILTLVTYKGITNCLRSKTKYLCIANSRKALFGSWYDITLPWMWCSQTIC